MPFCIYSQVYLLIQRGGTAEGERPAGGVDDRAHGQHGQLPRGIVSVEPRERRDVDGDLHHEHEQRRGNDRLEEGRPDLIGRLIKRAKQNRVEQRIEHQCEAEERDVRVHANEVAADGRVRAPHGERHRDHERGNLDQRREQARRLHGVALADGEDGGIVDVLLLAHVQEREEQPQHHIEPHDRERVVRDHQHHPEHAEDRRHRVAHQPQLLI